jgi:hypothetical protein
MTRLLLCAATLLALTASAHAQREGGAYFGPFSRGNSSGGDFTGPPNCTWGKEYCHKIERPKARQARSGKKGQ